MVSKILLGFWELSSILLEGEGVDLAFGMRTKVLTDGVESGATFD